MKNVTRVRVSVDDLSPSLQKQSREKVGMVLIRMFKKECADYGIMHLIKEKEHFVSRGEKRRKDKMRARMVKLKENTDHQKEWFEDN